MTALPHMASATTGVLRVSLAIGGTAFAALGVLAVIISVEGRFGPTPLLGVLGHVWEMIFTAALIPVLVAMFLACRAARSLSSSVIAVLAALCLSVAALIAVLRLAGLVDVFLPLANWLPGTLLLAIWGWMVARAAVREGYLGIAMRRAAGGILIAQLGLVAFAVTAVLVGGTNSPAPTISAGVAAAGIWIAVGVSWLAIAAQWRWPGRVVARWI